MLCFRPSVACIFQGRGVAASATTLGTSQLKADAHRSLTRSSSNSSSGTLHFPGSNAGIKKSSVCLQTKFKIVSFMKVVWRRGTCSGCDSVYLHSADLSGNVKVDRNICHYLSVCVCVRVRVGLPGGHSKKDKAVVCLLHSPADASQIAWGSSQS